MGTVEVQKKQLEYEEALQKLQTKMQLQSAYLFDKNWFKFLDNQVIMQIDNLKDTNTNIYVPDFVNILIIRQVSTLNPKIDTTLNKIVVCGNSLKIVSARDIKVQQLQIKAMKHITSQMFQNIEVVDKLIIGSDTKQISSYALCVKQGCLVDIRSLQEVHLDSNFIHIHKKTLNSLNDCVNKKCSILCNPQQYRYLQQLKLFKYRSYLKVLR